ncbi:MAG: MFS transporter [Clostridiaceae bacterium]
MQNDISKKNWVLIWVLGMAGQICWNVENSWFSTFVYNKVAPDPVIISWMVGVSAVVTTFCTFLVGTWSDRIGRRKPFVSIGYIFWGVFTIVFGLGEFMPKTPLTLVATFVVLADAIMSFFGSFGYDAGFSIWTTDISNEHNRGRLGGALAVMPVIATIFGTVVSGVIVEKLDYLPFFVIMGSMVILFGLVSLFAMKDAPDLKPRRDEPTYLKQLLKVFNWRTVRDNRELFWVFIVMVVYFIGFNVYFSYITIYFVNYLGYNYTVAGALQGGALVVASFMTVPAAKLIDQGKLSRVVLYALIANTVGLLSVAFASNLVILCIGMFLAGCGYILTLQSLTAWIKNLYPEDQRGQFEGIKQVFFVALPMVFGPMIAAPVINNWGKEMVVNGVTGMVPTPSLFLVSAAVTALTILPLIQADRLHKLRLSAAKPEPLG